MSDALPTLGDRTCDIHLNGRAFWRNVPAAVWNYRLGGYQVLKKWLSYRERDVIGRSLRPEEIQHFTDTARRIAMVVLESRLAVVESAKDIGASDGRNRDGLRDR